MQLFKQTRPDVLFALAGIMALAWVLLLVRSAGLYPAVMADEYIYSSLSRLMPLAEAIIPGYLYLALYKMTSLCGSGFLWCAKLFNTLFFVAAAPFIYAVARPVCSTACALLIVALSLLGPVNSYTAYYMPESLFWLTFWVCIWYFLRLKISASASQWLLFGVLTGAAALVKPHALLMIPGFCLCILFFSYKEAAQKWRRNGLKSVALMLTGVFVSKFAVGFLVAGKTGLTLFGSFYTTTLDTSTDTLQRYLDILTAVPQIVAGHVLANTLMSGAALAILLLASIKALASRTLKDEDRITACTLLLFLNLIAAVTLFSATVAGTNMFETATRIHMRYYNFMLPLLFIVAGSQLNRVHDAELRYWRLAVAIVILVILCQAALTRMQPFTPSVIDSPELRGYTQSPLWFMLLSGLSALAVLLWYLSARLGSLFFIGLYLPLSVTVSTFWNNAEVRGHMTIDAYDRAGLFARNYLPAEVLPTLVVIGESEPFLLRTLFHIDNRQVLRDMSYVPGKPYLAAQTPERTQWILAIGEVRFAEGEFSVMPFNGYSLARKVSGLYPLRVDFSRRAWTDPVSQITGLSRTEAWGAWSEGPLVDIRFSRPLPAQFDLTLSARAFGPNVRASTLIEVDGKAYPVSLNETSHVQTLRINTSGTANRLSIRIPAPVSPKALGLNQDERLLGVGLDWLEIERTQ